MESAVVGKANRPRPGGIVVANPVGTIEGPGVQQDDVSTPHQYGLENNDLTSIHTKDDGTIMQAAGMEKSSTLQKKNTFMMDNDSDIE